MGMKPRLDDYAKPIPGCVNQPQHVSEFGNIPGTVSNLHKEQDKPIPGVEACFHNVTTHKGEDE